MSTKISNSTCYTKLNPNILLCKQAKQAQNFQIVLVLPSKILMYYWLGSLASQTFQLVLVSPSQTKAGHKIVIALVLISKS